MKKFRISGCLFVVMLAVIMLAGCTRDRSGTQMSTQSHSSVPAETSIGESDTAPGMGMDTESEPAPSDVDPRMTMPDNQNGTLENEESTGVIGGLADDLERAVTNAADEVTGK